MTVEIQEFLTVEEIARFIGAQLVGTGARRVREVTTDSRDIREASVFVAIKGERFDGHDFVVSGKEKNMACAIVDHIPENCEGICLLVVPDTVVALGKLAHAYKTRLNPLTVAVTGSIGKTTTKEFIYAVLSEKFPTLKTEGNHNNQIGLPMTLLSLSHEHKAAVVELGMSAKGEIQYLSQMAAPNIAVITNIGTSHIEKLGSREGIRDAKLEITAGLQSGRALILNGDEPLLAGIPGATYVGAKNRQSDVFVDNIITGENGSAFDLTIKGEKVESLVIPAVGEHNVMNAAIAYTVGVYSGMGEFEIRRGLRAYKTTGMRQNIYENGGRVILEDCYNAAPESMLASLKVLLDISTAKKLRPVAVLGDMRELGFYSREGHTCVGNAVADLSISLLFTFGKEAKVIAEAAIEQGMDRGSVFSFEDISNTEAIVAALKEKTGKGDMILFKGSRAVAMERLIEKIKI